MFACFDVTLLTRWCDVVDHSPVCRASVAVKSFRAPSRVQHRHPAGEVRYLLICCVSRLMKSLLIYNITRCSILVGQCDTFRDSSCCVDQRFSTHQSLTCWCIIHQMNPVFVKETRTSWRLEKQCWKVILIKFKVLEYFYFLILYTSPLDVFESCS